eukprot:228450-Chlamydomonas_euryale.AAC.4
MSCRWQRSHELSTGTGRAPGPPAGTRRWSSYRPVLPRSTRWSRSCRRPRLAAAPPCRGRPARSVHPDGSFYYVTSEGRAMRRAARQVQPPASSPPLFGPSSPHARHAEHRTASRVRRTSGQPLPPIAASMRAGARLRTCPSVTEIGTVVSERMPTRAPAFAATWQRHGKASVFQHAPRRRGWQREEFSSKLCGSMALPHGRRPDPHHRQRRQKCREIDDHGAARHAPSRGLGGASPGRGRHGVRPRAWGTAWGTVLGPGHRRLVTRRHDPLATKNTTE